MQFRMQTLDLKGLIMGKLGKRLVTHGLRKGGPLPQLTEEGLAQFANLPTLEGVVRLAIVGTGIRFLKTREALVANGKLDGNVPVVYSPFCGSADGLDPPDTVVLADGTECKLNQYIGFGNTKAFDAWAFIDEQPDGTLFVAGGELMMALGCAKPAKGAIYALMPETKEFDLIAQG